MKSCWWNEDAAMLYNEKKKRKNKKQKHCSMANSVQAPEKLTAERKLKQMRTQLKPTERDPSIYA